MELLFFKKNGVSKLLDLETEIPLAKRNSEFRNKGIVGFRKNNSENVIFELLFFQDMLAYDYCHSIILSQWFFL